ncbi:MAG: class I SAM-dependent methyltransferase [Caldilineaceae bacterium]
MTPEITATLLQLNRAFYATVATAFDATRWIAGGVATTANLAASTGGSTPTGTRCWLWQWAFAWLLEEWGIVADYVGVDADAQLLTLAAQHAAGLTHVRCTFQQADFTEMHWTAQLALQTRTFDLVVCFAALHHVPGYRLRAQVVAGLADLVTTGGTIILSHWQFLTSARFVRKQIAWQTIGLSESDIEEGDALLPWHQNAFAVRYVHQTDEGEAQQLAKMAGLCRIAHFYADGKEGNLNLYTILSRVEESET